MIEALHYHKISDGKVKCTLCPHECVLEAGERGKCRVRLNRGGILLAENYGMIPAMHLDPIEKKPLYHFYPGSSIFSIGTIGCNLSCGFCQNCDISQNEVKEFPGLSPYSPDEIVSIALSTSGNIGLAYTYNEPAVFYEFIREAAPIASEKGLKNVFISNGFIEEAPLSEIISFIDAFNIDLKSFDNGFYKTQTGGRVKPVLNTLERIRKSGKHLEITTLIIPGLNDDIIQFKSMVSWIRDHLGNKTVLHLSRYFPSYRFTIPATSVETLNRLYEIAREQLTFTYLGNLMTGERSDTYCPVCGSLMIRRSGYQAKIQGIDQGQCSSCYTPVSDFIKIS
jgi:pyruvate formate lyase activating enzyme